MPTEKNKKIYMIGIKGVGMCMLAQFLQEKGYEVSGSDVSETFMTDSVLANADIAVKQGFSVENVPNDASLIIYSTAYNEKTNEEVALVLSGKNKALTYAEALGRFFKEYYGIAVIGSHGKTTTTAWLGYVLMKSGLSPNVMVGAKVKQFEASSITGDSEYLIIEADEYQNKLRYFDPKAVLLNNIDYDHPDYFPTKESYTQVFVDFIQKIPKKGFLVANNDDAIVRSIAGVNTRAKLITYGIEEAADYMAYDIRISGDQQFFRVKLRGETDESEATELGDFAISLSGTHNVYNALAVIAASVELGVELYDIRTHLETFEGTSRRMEVLGKYNGALIIDDYAHHPTEIRMTLAGARAKYPDRRIVTVFHPHTFTRTKGLLDEFSHSFADTDELIVLDIYGSAREVQGGIHSKDLILKIEAMHPDLHIVYIPDLAACEIYLRQKLKSRDLLLLMGAGDVFRIAEKLLAA
jgi:UDP-N-acetylmuramate--alanine ligase